MRSCVLSCRVVYGFDLCLPRLGIPRALTHAYAEHVARRSVLLSCAPYDDDATSGLNGDASTTGLPGREHGLSSRARARAPERASERAREREREREKETDAHGIMQAKNGAGERKTACAIAMLVCVRGKRWGRRKSKDGGQRCRFIVQLPAWCRLMLAAHPAAPILRAVSPAVPTRRKLKAVRSKWKRGTGWQQQVPVEQVELLSAAAGLA